jgi:hypothetical protein
MPVKNTMAFEIVVLERAEREFNNILLEDKS